MPLLLKRSAGEEFGSSGQQPMTLSFPKHVPLNSLFYNKDGVRLTDRELEQRARGPPRQILAKNTRLASSSVEDPANTAEQDIADLFGSGARSTLDPDPGQESQHGGIKGSLARRLASPSFTPGPQFSPLMTWGQIDSTPVRLDVEAAGPFKVQETSSREKTLHNLVDAQSMSIKKRPSLPMGLSPHHPSMARLPHLSPAAHSLAAKITGSKTPLHGSRGGGVNDLRASYSNHPAAGGGASGRRGITPTPTPSAGVRQRSTPHPN